jgi:hypothetical protein
MPCLSHPRWLNNSNFICFGPKFSLREIYSERRNALKLSGGQSLEVGFTVKLRIDEPSAFFKAENFLKSGKIINYWRKTINDGASYYAECEISCVITSVSFKLHSGMKYLILSRVLVTIDGVWISWLNLLHLYTQLGTTGNYSAIADLNTSQFTVTHALGFSVFTSRILATDFNSVITPVVLYCSTHEVFFHSYVISSQADF